MTVQSEWAWCSKCQGLFYGPHQAASACPKGGTHIAGTGSYNYGVSYTGTYVPSPPPSPPVTPPPPPASTRRRIPARIAGCYWTGWSPLPLGNVNRAYNLIWLFAAKCAANGTASWSMPSSETPQQFIADLQAKRAAGVCCLLTVGGSGAAMPLTSRANSTNFVNSIKALDLQLGGIDGLDFDIEINADINAAELTWIAQQLKAALPGFSITWAGADPSWITSGPAAVRAMVAANVLDLVAVMCYDWGQSAEAAKIAKTEAYITEWAGYAGASRICIGIELPNADDAANNTFGSAASAITVWHWALAAYPAIRGMDIWTAYEDARATGGSGGTFVTTVIPVVLT